MKLRFVKYNDGYYYIMKRNRLIPIIWEELKTTVCADYSPSKMGYLFPKYVKVKNQQIRFKTTKDCEEFIEFMKLSKKPVCYEGYDIVQMFNVNSADGDNKYPFVIIHTKSKNQKFFRFANTLDKAKKIISVNMISSDIN